MKIPSDLPVLCVGGYCKLQDRTRTGPVEAFRKPCSIGLSGGLFLPPRRRLARAVLYPRDIRVPVASTANGLLREVVFPSR